MAEKDPGLDALRLGESLRQLANTLRRTAFTFQELTDAVIVLLVFLDEAASYGRLSDSFQRAVDNVKSAMEKVA